MVAAAQVLPPAPPPSRMARATGLHGRFRSVWSRAGAAVRRNAGCSIDLGCPADHASRSAVATGRSALATTAVDGSKRSGQYAQAVFVQRKSFACGEECRGGWIGGCPKRHTAALRHAQPVPQPVPPQCAGQRPQHPSTPPVPQYTPAPASQRRMTGGCVSTKGCRGALWLQQRLTMKHIDSRLQQRARPTQARHLNVRAGALAHCTSLPPKRRARQGVEGGAQRPPRR